LGEISEGELRAGLRDGGRITGVLVVARTVDEAIEFTPYFLLSWRRGYFHIARWRGGERRYREFHRLLAMLREHGWADCVPVYDAADPKLLRIRAVARAMGLPPLPRPGRGGRAAEDVVQPGDCAPPDTDDEVGPA
jgi:hypothetical protein